MLEVLLMMGTALIVAVVLAPVAARLARPQTWNPAPMPPMAERTREQREHAFEPLDLGPDPTRWPSEEKGRQVDYLPEPPWPSQGWDDEYFGASRKKSVPEASAAVAEVPVEQLVKSKERPPKKQAPKRTPAKQPVEVVSAPGVPDVREMERLVREHGLAGAVQEIMKRTGWEFREAAQHLAEARRKMRQ